MAGRAIVIGLYEDAAARLSARGLVYGCACSRQDLGDASCYPGTCRDRNIAPGPGVTWRLRLAPGDETFDDWLMGPQTQNPASHCGDVVDSRSPGQLVVSVRGQRR
jgi:glutamyl-Q tRNA(Asp) synthetase